MQSGLPITNPVFVVIGGGIAGVSCAEALVSYMPECRVILISASPLIKAVREIKNVTRTLTTFKINESALKEYESSHPNIEVIHSCVSNINYSDKFITFSGKHLKYNKLCICTGASPKTLLPHHDRILTIRDTETAVDLDRKLANCRRVIIVLSDLTT